MPHDMISVDPSPLGPPQQSMWGGHSSRQLLFVLLKWRWLVLGLSLLFAVTTGWVFLQKPAEYQATAKILFNEDRAPLQISGLSKAHA